MVWQLLVVLTGQGSNHGICTKKSPTLCSLAWAAASLAEVTVRCAGLCYGDRRSKFSLDLVDMGQDSGGFSTGVIQSLFNAML